MACALPLDTTTISVVLSDKEQIVSLGPGFKLLVDIEDEEAGHRDVPKGFNFKLFRKYMS